MGHSRAITTITPRRVNGERGRRVSCFISMPHALRKGGYIAAAKSSRFEQISLSAYRLKFLHDSGFRSILHSSNLYSAKANETRELDRLDGLEQPSTSRASLCFPVSHSSRPGEQSLGNSLSRHSNNSATNDTRFYFRETYSVTPIVRLS